MKKHEIVLINIPAVLQKKFKRAVRYALRFVKLSEEFENKKIQVVLIYDPMCHYLLKDNALFGYPYKDKSGCTIIVQLGLPLFELKDEDDMEYLITLTVLHELLHAMRVGNTVSDIGTYEDLVIEEGLAVWLTGRLVGLAPDFDIALQTTDNMKKNWQLIQPRFHQKIDDQRLSINSKINELGYYLIEEYWKKKKSVTFGQMLHCKRATLRKYLHTLF